MVEQAYPSTGGAAQKLREGAQELKETVAVKAEEAVGKVSARMKQYAEKASETLEAYTEEAVTVIKERPLASVLVAFGAGVLLGLLFMRKS